MTRAETIFALKKRKQDGRKLRHMSVKELKALLDDVTPKDVGPVDSPLPPAVFIDPTIAQATMDKARQKFATMAAYYSPREPMEVPDRVVDYARKVFFVGTREEAEFVVDRALMKMHSHCLNQWACKKISGPDTQENIAIMAEKQMSYAKKLQADYDKARKDKPNHFSQATEDKIAAQLAKVAATKALPPVEGRVAPWKN